MKTNADGVSWNVEWKSIVMTSRIVVPVLAIFGIVGLDVYALSCGIDGTALAASVGAIAGIAGWYAKGIFSKEIFKNNPK